ncbi:MAG: ATP-binding protein, partial [Candidatus Eremiobacteraeota bacterium]|nr:ATP-binding protein [Candidatus Eremiobacteraeota bacterium]
PGVPAEIRTRVFDRRVRARDGAGMGLGLSISRWVARAHGGDIMLEDRARFVARIPRLIEHDVHL